MKCYFNMVAIGWSQGFVRKTESFLGFTGREGIKYSGIEANKLIKLFGTVGKHF